MFKETQKPAGSFESSSLAADTPSSQESAAERSLSHAKNDLDTLDSSLAALPSYNDRQRLPAALLPSYDDRQRSIVADQTDTDVLRRPNHPARSWLKRYASRPAAIVGLSVAIAVSALQIDEEMGAVYWGNDEPVFNQVATTYKPDGAFANTTITLPLPGNVRCYAALSEGQQTSEGYIAAVQKNSPSVEPDQTARPALRSAPSSNEVSTAPKRTTGIFVIGGHSIKDASRTVAEPLIDSLGSLPDSNYYALREGTKLDLENTFAAFDKVVQRDQPKQVDLYGMSMGGIEAMYLAQHTRQKYPGLPIRSIYLDSTPPNAESTYELSEDSWKLTLSQLSGATDLHGGIAARMLTEINARKDQLYNIDGSFSWTGLAKVASVIKEVKLNHCSASNALIAGQARLIGQGLTQELFNSLARDNESVPPTKINYIMPTADQVVKQPKAMQQIKVMVESAGLPFKLTKLKGLPHASEHVYQEEYNLAIKNSLARGASS